MPNRFYVPTPTQYTSQFVEKQYPFGEMLALEEKKTQRAENISAGMGELESLLAPLTTPGHYTQEIAGQTKTDLQQQISKFAEEHQDDWTSINTIRDLSKLRGDVLNDPRVQAMQLDRDVWSPQWDQVRLNRKSNLDIDPNVDPTTGAVKQWHPGESFPTVQPLKGYVNYRETFDKIFSNVNPVETYSGPYVRDLKDAKGNTVGQYMQTERTRTADETTFAPHVASLTNDIIGKGSVQGNYEEADWYKEDFLRRNPGQPLNYENIYKDLMDMALVHRVDETVPLNTQMLEGTTKTGTPPTPEEQGAGEMGIAIPRSLVGNYKSTGVYRDTRKGTVKTNANVGEGFIKKVGKGLETAAAWVGTDHEENIAKVEAKYKANERPPSLRNEFDIDNLETISEGQYLQPSLFVEYEKNKKPELYRDADGIEVEDPKARDFNKVAFAKAGENYLNSVKTQAIQLPRFNIPEKGGEKYMNDLLSNKIDLSVSEKNGKNVTTWDEVGFNPKSPYYVEWGDGISDRKTGTQLKDKWGYNGIIFKETIGNENPYWPMAIVGHMYTGKNEDRVEKEKEIVRFNPTWVNDTNSPADLHDWTGWNFKNGVNPRSIMPIYPQDFIEFDGQGMRDKPIDEQISYLESKRIPYVYTTFNPERSDYIFSDGTKSTKPLPRYYVSICGYDNEGNPIPYPMAEGVTRVEAWDNYSKNAASLGQ